MGHVWGGGVKWAASKFPLLERKSASSSSSHEHWEAPGLGAGSVLARAGGAARVFDSTKLVQ